MLVHVDDILMTGQMDEIEKIFADLRAAMKLREEGRLERPGDKGQFLGRRLHMTEKGYDYESGTATVRTLWAQLGLEKAKQVDSPATKSMTSDEQTPLTEEEYIQYRSALGKELYIGHDHPVIQFATGQAARCCAAPTKKELRRVNRIARYLRKAPVSCWHFELTKEPSQITGFSDSDWAGDEKTRRSTSGGILLVETGHEEEERTIAAVHAWSRAQGPIALSSMEAEYYALITTCQEARALQSLLEEIL